MAEGFVIKLSVKHHCMNIESLEKLKDKDAKTVMKTITRMTDKEITHVFTAESKKPKELLELHRKHPHVKKIDVLAKDKNKVTFLMTTKADIGVAHALAKSKCIVISPVVTEEDCDNLTIFAPTWNAYRKFVDSLPEDFEVTVKSKRSMDDKVGPEMDAFKVIGFLELKTLSEMLTPRQIEVLNVAIGKGYYSKPRKITLNELAEYLDMAPSTLSEHLNKIEAKVMPVISKILRSF